jgi:PAS domain S-box-containing protein
VSFEYSPYVLPLVAAALVSGWALFFIWPYRETKSSTLLLFLTAGVTIWCVGYALEIAGTDITTKLLWGKFQYLGITVIPVAWLFFALTYTNETFQFTRRMVGFLTIIPFITILLTFTTEFHGLIWKEYGIFREGSFSALELSHGSWFWVYWVYSQLLLLIGTVIMVRSLLQARGAFRGQRILFFIAVLSPWVGNILYITGNSPVPHLDLTAFAFTVSVASLTLAIFGFRLMDIAPLARDRIVDSMREGMVVLDVRGNIVDINNAAARMIGVPVADAVGKDAGDVFSPWTHLVERFRNVMEGRDEISIGAGETRRSYEVRLSPLQNPQGQIVGRVIMLRAMDDEIPQPRFSARSEASSDNTQPIHDMGDNEETENNLRTEKKAVSIWGSLINYYFVPIKMDISVPIGINPVWYRTRERIFTIFARIGASVGLIAVVLVLRSFLNTVNLVFAALVAFLWMLGAVRSVKYEFRVIGFLALVYGLAFIETLNFGFSADSFAFFMGFTIVAAVLTSWRGAVSALAVAFSSLSAFFVLLNSGTFIPLTILLEGGKPPDVNISSLLVFVACALATTVAIVILLENLNASWQKETQTLNLLQQEHDLLEQRVVERTHALAEARDEAEKSSNDLRKYFRAIEQSGNTIVITDINGNIEYANPRFTQSTGYTAEEAKGKNPRILKSGKQPTEYYSQLWETISEGNIWTGEFLNKRKNGSLYWESATIAPVLDQNGEITNYVAIKEDVTARRKTEEQLQKLSQAVEQSGNTVLIMDKNGLIEYVNPKFTEVTGYSSEEALGKSPIALMNSLERAPDFSQDEWWLTVTAGQIWRGEFRNHRKDGSAFWESATIAPVLNRDGEAINFVEIKQDITEQKIMQDQLQKQNDYLSILHQITLDLLNRRELNDLLQVIVDRSAVLLDAPYSKLLLEKDGELVVEAFTGGLVNIKGERSPSKLSRQAFDSHQPVVLEDYHTWKERRREYDDLSLYAAAEIPVMAGDRCLGVLALARTEPNYRFTAEQIETGILFVRLVALVLDNANLFDSAMKEISERKRTEALLLESETRFRQIVENASDIIYRVDMNGNCTYANPSTVKMMGYASEQEVLGKNYLDLTAPEFRHKLKRVYDHQYLSKTRSTYYEFPAVTADGQIIWIGQNVQLIMDGEQIVGFQALARNITQLKQAQEALALSRDQALEASRFKSQLLSRVSHELRTPLGGILGFAELLEYNAFGSLTDEQQDAVGNIIESTNYLTNIVNDLLDEAQIESKSINLHNEHFKPADLLEKITTTLSTLAVKKGITVHAEIDPQLPGELYGDVNRLQQIFINLGGNAVKFTKMGEVRVDFKRPNPAQWSIEVRDTGAGIPMEDQLNIFEPFRQVSNSITRENRGSGLGLAITKQLVELMGGHISLESEVGKGALFTVTLPIINAPGE